MAEAAALTALCALGFSDLEARIYCELVQSGAATGYRIAKSIGRPGANVYQALNGMHLKGSVLLADAASKTYRAPPPEELLATLDRGFRSRLDSAQSALASIGSPPSDNFLYQLASVDQAYEHARAMINRAQVVLLFDLFPEPFQLFAPLLADAQARGVTVAGTVYDKIADPVTGGFAHLAPNSDEVREAYPGSIMTFVADASQYIETLLSSGSTGLLKGVWTDSPYLACAKHSALGTEIRLNLLLAKHADPFPQISLMRSGAPGLRLLRRKNGS